MEGEVINEYCKAIFQLQTEGHQYCPDAQKPAEFHETAIYWMDGVCSDP